MHITKEYPGESSQGEPTPGEAERENPFEAFTNHCRMNVPFGGRTGRAKLTGRESKLLGGL